MKPGEWKVLPVGTEILAVHAALMRTRHRPQSGEVLCFGGSQYRPELHAAHNFQSTRLHDWRANTVRAVDSPDTDVFCCGHAMLMDGRLLVAGGTEDYADTVPGIHHPHFPGLANAWIFDPGNDSRMPWQEIKSMAGGGRWYPGLSTLGSGRVWVMCGHPENADTTRHNNNTPVVFDEFAHPQPWTVFQAPTAEFERSAPDDREYPRLHLLPNGILFCATALGDGTPPGFPFGLHQVIDPANGARAFAAPAIDDENYFIGNGIFTTSVLLPLLPEDGYRPRVLACGGKRSFVIDLGDTTAATSDPNFVWNNPGVFQFHAEWTETEPRKLSTERRLFLTAVLLPTGAVFICGGVNSPGAPGDPGVYLNTDAVRRAEVYEPIGADRLTSNPGDWTWSLLEEAEVIRNYHSVALLLPDGRVWTAGSSTDHDGGKPPELRIEIYEPWYCKVPRPVIEDAPRTVDYGSSFRIAVSNAHTIRRVALLRAGSVTHSFNSDQRYVGVEFDVAGDSHLAVVSPPHENVAPPGLYLLFVIDRDGVASEGRFIYVKSSWFQIAPAETTSQPVTALRNAGNPQHLDAFVVRGDGTVLSAFWEPSASWVPWFAISPPGTASPSQPVTALWNAGNPQHLDAFVVRGDGTVLSTFWEPSTSWVPWFAIGQPRGRPLSEQPVRVLWSPKQASYLDLFAVARDGSVWSIWWSDFLSGW